MRTKEEIRQEIWNLLERENIALFPRPCHGRIPNFNGTLEATKKLLELKEFLEAKCVFCAPDYALKPARDQVLACGKKLAVATPHMRSFLELGPTRSKLPTTIKGLFKYGKPLSTPVDLIIEGSVAVDLKGNRLGKGAGYGDQEIVYLREQGLAREGALIVSLVHDLQIVGDMTDLMGPSDISVDIILTPTKIHRIKKK